MKKIYAILPCYNEEENIGKLIETWNKQTDKLKKQQYDLKIIAIDDCSTDKTKNKILEKKKKYDNVDIIIHPENRGLCGGLNSAINYFNKKGKPGDLLVLMDGDNTHHPKYVNDMLTLLTDDKNCIIASRYREGSNIVGLAKNRELMSEFAKLYYQMILNIPNVKDYTCGYRMYTYEIIDKLINKFGNNPIKEKSFACMMELLYKVYLVGGQFDEVGFELRYDNKRGESKMKVFKTAQRSITTAIKLKFRYNFPTLITILMIIMFSIFLSLGTNYSPINENILEHDCSIFSYVALAMKKGRVLYSEIWENKGPLLYFIYYIGMSLNKNYGIYILELISIFISVLFSYKSLKIITNKKIYSILGVIYSFSIWSVTLEKGTLSENFALPLICMGMYLFTKYILSNSKKNNLHILFFGILTGLIAQLRLNMLAIFLAMFIIIGIRLIINKELKTILKWLLFGIIGVVISLIPSFIYLIKNGALLDCLNIAYLDILNGFDVGSINDRWNALLKMIDTVNISCVVFVIIGFIILSCILIKYTNKENKFYILATILSIALNLCANSISGAANMHYFLTFIPIIAMVIGSIIKMFDKINISYIIKISILTLIICAWSYPSYHNYFVQYKNNMIPMYHNKLYLEIDEYIYKNTNENDLVQLIGGNNESVGANFRTERLSASKYSYLPLWQTFTENKQKIMANELVDEMQINIPKLIFIYNNTKTEFNELINDEEKWNNFLTENYSIDDTTIKEYMIYIRK